MSEPMKKLIGVLGVILIILGIVYLMQHIGVPGMERRENVNYNAARICDGAFETKHDLSVEKITNTTLDLTEGCFGPLVRLPNAWDHWEFQPAEQSDRWWVAFWAPGTARGTPVYGPNDSPRAQIDPHKGFFRLQGHGKIRLYSNDVIPR